MSTTAFVPWFRAAAPYVHAFRGRTFVIAFGGEVVASDRFIGFVHDLNLLLSLGVKLVLVHGSRPQIEAALKQRGLKSHYLNGVRVTDRATLECVLEASGRVRTEVEALLSMGLDNSPMAGARIRVAGGNFVTAKPIGVINGTDMLYTGEVRKIDATAIAERLANGDIALLSALGFSATGEIFNLTLEEVATQTAIALIADKLVFMQDTDGVHDKKGKLLSELSTGEAQRWLSATPVKKQPGDVRLYLPSAIRACQHGVARSHLISWRHDGSILSELFTRTGVGTMLTHRTLEQFRTATIDDVGPILTLIEPLEAAGILVRRSRERLELEINRFIVVEHDSTIIGCAALYPFPRAQMAELACLAVHPDFRNRGCGDALLRAIEARARQKRVKTLFVLTTRAAHWFVERGFVSSDISRLPRHKQSLYNYQRRSQVFEKDL